MLYEKNVEEAVRVLHEICYILPQLPIEGLSYIDSDYSQHHFKLPRDNQIIDEEIIEVAQTKLKPHFTKSQQIVTN